MAAVTFKAKPETIYNVDGTVAYRRVKVPKLSARHCDMAAFRRHPKYSSYANSQLFPGMLRSAVGKMGVREYIRLDEPLPAGVSVDVSGFLALVTIEL